MSSKRLNIITSGFCLSLFLLPLVFAQDQGVLKSQANKQAELQSLTSDSPTNTVTSDRNEQAEEQANEQTDSQSLDSESKEAMKALTQQVEKLRLEQKKLKLEHESRLLQLQQEKEKLLLENELHAAREAHKEAQLLAELNALQKRLSLENAINQLKQKQLQTALENERDKLALHNAILEERHKQRELEFLSQLNELHQKKRQLDEQIAERKKKQEWESQVNTPQTYLKQPFVDGQLIISERRIALEGPIVFGTADYIVERIQYFNNKSTEYPIFLVIGYSPGGSVMEGIRIIKAMHKSRAPVYVVVQSFAASMAAVITTLAERSYSYPDAIFIHHQVWGVSRGNRTEQLERLKILEEWTTRILQPVAKKMGITLEKFIEKMYEYNSNGDWFEFASNAIRHQWVDYIVDDIRDTSFVKQPKLDENNFGLILRQSPYEESDSQKNRYIRLPHLKPFDVYHLYNRDNYYRY